MLEHAHGYQMGEVRREKLAWQQQTAGQNLQAKNVFGVRKTVKANINVKWNLMPTHLLISKIVLLQVAGQEPMLEHAHGYQMEEVRREKLAWQQQTAGQNLQAKNVFGVRKTVKANINVKWNLMPTHLQISKIVLLQVAGHEPMLEHVHGYQMEGVRREKLAWQQQIAGQNLQDKNVYGVWKTVKANINVRSNLMPFHPLISSIATLQVATQHLAKVVWSLINNKAK